MYESILDHHAKDGIGYEKSFFRKLNQRLVDEIRRQRKNQERNEPFQETEDGEVIEPADPCALDPEQVLLVNELIQSLPDKLRRAFLLRRAGFDYYSPKSEVPTIASMMECSDKSARKWVADAEKLIREKIGAKS
jgi:DNA-directed RNA polymerase specialized sigma24 family protein